MMLLSHLTSHLFIVVCADLLASEQKQKKKMTEKISICGKLIELCVLKAGLC